MPKKVNFDPSSVKDFISGDHVQLGLDTSISLLPDTEPTKIDKRTVRYDAVLREFGTESAMQVTLRRGAFNRALSGLGLDILPTPVLIERTDTDIQ